MSVFNDKPNEHNPAHTQTAYQTIPYDLLHLSMQVSSRGRTWEIAGEGFKGGQMLKKGVFLVKVLSECWQNTKLIVLVC